MFRKLLYIILFTNVLFSQSLTFTGQFWAIFSKNDYYKSNEIGYIPSLSFNKNIDKNSFIDFELSYYIIKRYNSLNNLITDSEKYRYWIRYADNNFDIRIGLQKISFGQSFIFRPLSWFDDINYTNITGNTKGVNAVRLIFNPNNNYGIWGWIIDSGQKVPSYGFRLELSDNSGEWGFSYHMDSSKKLQFLNQSVNILNYNNTHSLISFKNNQRLGFDYRYDGNFGFWSESSSYIIKKPDNIKRIDLAVIGFDLSIPNRLTSITLSTETMYNYFLSTDNSFIDGTFSSFNLNFNIDIMNDFMFVSILDWQEEEFYNYLKWSNIYDHFRIDMTVSINPKLIGNSFELLFTYNH